MTLDSGGKHPTPKNNPHKIFFFLKISFSTKMKMGCISPIRNISKHFLRSNYLTEINSSSQQQWRFYTRAQSPFRFTNTRNTSGSSSLYMLSLSRAFSTLNSKSKVGFIEWYLGKLNSRPIPTKTITTSLIYAAADLTAQVNSI